MDHGLCAHVEPRLFVRLAGDLLAEGATVLAESGAVAVRSRSSAPGIVLRAGGQLHGELGLGVRIGIVHIQGEALPKRQLVGERLVRIWAPPRAISASR